jgi:hypothetical protein
MLKAIGSIAESSATANRTHGNAFIIHKYKVTGLFTFKKDVLIRIEFSSLNRIFKMATTSVEASNLFHVKGLVAVIAGGGSGSCHHPGLILKVSYINV